MRVTCADWLAVVGCLGLLLAAGLCWLAWELRCVRRLLAAHAATLAAVHALAERDSLSGLGRLAGALSEGMDRLESAQTTLAKAARGVVALRETIHATPAEIDRD